MVGQLVIRSDPADARGIIALFEAAYGGQYPASELRAASALRQHLERGAETFFAAISNDVVVGCVSSRALRPTVDLATREHIAEIGRLCTSPAISNRGEVAKQLCAVAIAASGRAGARGWYATVRTGPSLRIAKSLGFVEAGYTEEHVVGEKREPHVIMLRTTPGLLGRRVTPFRALARGSIYSEALVRAVAQELDLGDAPVARYPTEDCVVDDGVLYDQISFQAFANERRVRLATLPVELSPYMDVMVLCDKTCKVRALLETGWRLTAFLPAWYRSRFDAVLLSRSPGAPVETADALLSKRLQRYRELGRAPLMHEGVHV